MKHRYQIAAHLPKPLAHYGLNAPGAAIRARSADFDSTYAESQLAGLGLLTAWMIADDSQHQRYVTNFRLDARDQIIALCDVAPFVCRHQTVADYLDDPQPAHRRAASLLLLAMSVVQAEPRSRKAMNQQGEADRQIGVILAGYDLDTLLAAVKVITVASCSPDHLDRFGDSLIADDTPLAR